MNGVVKSGKGKKRLRNNLLGDLLGDFVANGNIGNGLAFVFQLYKLRGIRDTFMTGGNNETQL